MWKTIWRRNKGPLLLSSLVILLPVLVGAVLWSRLPDPMPIHFGVDNRPNGWAGKSFAVLGLPLILLALHWVCVWATAADPKARNISPSIRSVTLWLCPAYSMLTCVTVYPAALGRRPDVELLCGLFLGVVSLALGNYLPKCRPNHTVGIRTPWALRDPDNWQRTQRVAGWSMTLCGLALLPAAALRIRPLLPVLLTASVAVPMVYSYHIRKKEEPQ